MKDDSSGNRAGEERKQLSRKKKVPKKPECTSAKMLNESSSNE